MNWTNEKVPFKEVISSCLENHVIFAAYRMPESDYPRLVVQADPLVCKGVTPHEAFQNEGFFIHPFDYKTTEPVLIQPDYFFSKAIRWSDFQMIRALVMPEPPYQVPIVDEAVDKNTYLRQIQNIRTEIAKGTFEKVVLSRAKVVEGRYKEQIASLFNSLCENYSYAFVFLFSLGNEIWMGASPEPFLLGNGMSFRTSSIAGTRPNLVDNYNIDDWGDKELKEQEYVTVFIRDILKQFNVANLVETGPYIRKAANVLHLRTDISFEKQFTPATLGSFVQVLHPTSAVCGIPKNESQAYLKKIEKHDRSFYSGFLGPVNLENKTSLFVNLRSMKILDDQLMLYVGGGITIDSVAEDEWMETEIKADTLLQIIQQVRGGK